MLCLIFVVMRCQPLRRALCLPHILTFGVRVRLKSDFFGDWVNIQKDILMNHWGYDVSSVPDNEIPFLYFNAEQRRPEAKVRQLLLADTFSCPQNLESGWERLKGLIKSGHDLTPNLSKLVNNLNNKDSMLNDWGVHHFHLGENMKGDFIERTGPLLFALLVEDKFYAIGIFNHGSWADQDIVEIIHRNWSSVVERYQIKGIVSSTPLTEQERLNLRKRNANSFVTVQDGTVYAPIGGGMVSSGFNMQAVMRKDRQQKFLRNLEQHLDSQLASLREVFEKQGYRGEPELEAILDITEDKYTALFPKYGVSAILWSKA
ncbi:hypothetical protein F0H41_18795 [Vibrio cholerae]|nr:hypothetical protein F0H41_18795 [Vibrio cholerae]KAA1004594.1 hypothetical protein F0H40_18875 [Vibrio cholerae]KAA1012301.1 hypothetical protein F0H43_18915 [Vibrio cholerae]KAA1019103.1 hypothetical protein F0H42_19055 [Vibrio cholerae]KAA1022326.1 hypothetical protein F0H44_18730 [Vibrio cholerae]